MSATEYARISGSEQIGTSGESLDKGIVYFHKRYSESILYNVNYFGEFGQLKITQVHKIGTRLDSLNIQRCRISLLCNAVEYRSQRVLQK